MPHIHTAAGQHDMTVSAYIIRREGDDWKCLVHMHRKVGKLMQVGGHVELDETPWQTLIHEISDESGYQAAELRVLQILQPPHLKTATVHPAPFASNTHNVGNSHFHSDWCYGFIADDKPSGSVTSGESTDVRWCTVAELRSLAEEGVCLRDIIAIYEFLVSNVSSFQQYSCEEYSLKKPVHGETVIA